MIEDAASQTKTDFNARAPEINGSSTDGKGGEAFDGTVVKPSAN